MKIRWHGMTGTMHSWSFVSQALARAMGAAGHSVHIKSTNSLKHFPEDLEHMLLPGWHCHPSIEQEGQPLHYLTEDRRIVLANGPNALPEIPDGSRPYDLEIAYTIFMQAARRFFPETLAKMVIWNAEQSMLSPGWHEYHRAVDLFLPSSRYCRDIFVANGVPESKCIVVPHGVDQTRFHPGIPPFPLRTAKNFKFLHNAIPHGRKMHDRVIRAYFDAFTSNDDVCLVIKTKLKTPDADKPFEVDVRQILAEEARGRANLPEVEIVQSFIPDIGSLYTACDVVISLGTEGYNLPVLESLSCGCLSIAARYGGQLDFLTDSNSLLVDTGEMPATREMQYWGADESNLVGNPDTRHCSELMRKVYDDPDVERARTESARKATVASLTWETAAKQITDLADGIIMSKRRSPRLARRKVFYIVPYRWSGGGEFWVREALRRLDHSLYEPTVVFPAGTDEGTLSLFAGSGARLENLEEREKSISASLFGDPDACPDRRNRAQAEAFLAMLEAEKPDIAHFHNSLYVYNLLLKCLQAGAWRGRIVETAHSELSWSDSMSKVGKRKGVSLMAAVSRSLAAKLAAMGNRNVAFLPQQVDWERFRRKRGREFLDSLGVQHDGRPVFGAVGRLSPEKGMAVLLECARLMPDALFLVAGTGPQETALKAASAPLGNVVWLGRLEDTSPLYPALDALLISSSVEGLPLVALEAMAAGTPVVASAVGAIHEVVRDGETGFLCRSRSPAEFSALLRRTVGLERDTLVAGALATAFAQEEAGRKADINRLYSLLFARGARIAPGG